MAVESRGDLASRHGSIGRIAGAHSWSYRSDNPICTRTKKTNVILNLVEDPLKGSLLLNESMVLQEPSCVESAHHTNELLNNRLTNRLLHVTRCCTIPVGSQTDPSLV